MITQSHVTPVGPETPDDRKNRYAFYYFMGSLGLAVLYFLFLPFFF